MFLLKLLLKSLKNYEYKNMNITKYNNNDKCNEMDIYYNIN